MPKRISLAWMRDYNELVRRLEALASDTLQRKVLGEVEGYPIYRLGLGDHRSNPTVLLIGGTHGDEPAGVEALLDLAANELGQWAHRFNFEIIPCLNPGGYVRNLRDNAQGADINWSWGQQDVPEFQLFYSVVQNRRFLFSMDFHEDWESPGFYFYTVCRNGPDAGAAVIRAVEPFCSINRSDQIEELPALDGVITPDPIKVEQSRGRGIPTGLLRHHTDHFLVTETPTELDMAVRVRAHKTALRTLMELYSGLPTD
jgi:protein MpaA